MPVITGLFPAHRWTNSRDHGGGAGRRL